MEQENKRCEEELVLQQLLVAKVKPKPKSKPKPKPKPKPKVPVAVDFSVDDILILILARLSAKTLQKFRCVCKSWNSLIRQDHHFLSLHQLHLNDDNNKKRSTPPLITLFTNDVLECVINYSSSSDDDTRTLSYKIDFTRLQEDPSYFINPSYFITNSSNGLLGVYNRDNSFFIVNPSIRKLRSLPTTCTPTAWFLHAALGFDASAGVYKVVRIFDHEYTDGFGCEVYYLGGESDGWKSIDGPPVKPSCDSLPIVLDGAIIWASETLWEKDREVVALSFDLREEKFSVILHPEGGSSRPRYPKSHVFTSEGSICVADEIPCPVPIPYTHIEHMNIWLLMKEDDKKKNCNSNNKRWVKQYVVDLTYVFENIGPFAKAQPLTTDHKGRIVMSWGRGRKHYYDPRTGSFDKHELDVIHTDFYDEHVAPYTESMVWPWPSQALRISSVTKSCIDQSGWIVVGSWSNR